MSNWSFGSKLLAYLAAMLALSFVGVVAKREWGIDTRFLTGWIMCSLFCALGGGSPFSSAKPVERDRSRDDLSI